MSQRHKDHIVSVRLSPKEAERLQAHAQAEGCGSLSRLLRRLLSPIVGSAPDPKPDTIETLLIRIQRLEARTESLLPGQTGDPAKGTEL